MSMILCEEIVRQKMTWMQQGELNGLEATYGKARIFGEMFKGNMILIAWFDEPGYRIQIYHDGMVCEDSAQDTYMFDLTRLVEDIVAELGDIGSETNERVVNNALKDPRKILSLIKSLGEKQKDYSGEQV